MRTRRQFIAAVGAAALAGCNDALTGAAENAPYSPGDERTDWPTPGYDRSYSAFAPEAVAPREDPGERWSKSGVPHGQRPVAVDGTVVVEDANELVALDAASGDERWRTASADGVPASGTTVVGDTVYTATGGEERSLVALSLADGTERWPVETRGDVSAAPTPSDPDADWLFVGDDEGTVYQVDRETGDVRHERRLFGGVTLLAASRSPSPSVLAGTTAGEVYALYDDEDRLAGRWRRKLGGEVTGLSTADGKITAATFGGPVYRLRGGAHTGRTRWARDEAGRDDLAVTPHHVVAAGGGGISVLEADSGEDVWTTEGRYSAPAVAGDTLYVGGERGVEAYAMTSGERRWRFETDGRVEGRIAVADGAVFAVTTEGTLYALD